MIGVLLQEKAGYWKSGLSLTAADGVADGLRRVSELLGRLDGFLLTVPGMDAGSAADLRLLCDEIASNVVRHAASGSPVRLDIEIETGKRIRLRLVDDGDEFNPFAQACPYLGSDLERRKAGGLGLFLIRQIFPFARYQRLDGRNVTEVECHPGKGEKEECNGAGNHRK